MNPRNFFAELKRRNVYKVAAAYAVVGWLVVQIATGVLPTFHAPEWVSQTLVLLVLLGFPIALILAWAFELTPEGIKRAEDVSPDDSITHKTGRKLIVLVLTLAVGLFLFRMTRSKPVPAVTTSAPTAEAGPHSVPEKSIAVLPFENLSDDKQNAFFTDGVHDEILTDLAKVADLKVISRTSVMQYRTGARNLQEIARALKVSHVVEGTVQRSVNRVRVTAQLIDARNDMHLWAEKYDRDLADVFAIQSEIAQKIADQLQAKISPKEQAAIQAKPTANLAAYDLYLRGNEIDRNNTDNSLAKWTAELEFFEKAVAQDSAFVPALCSAARAHLALYWFNYDHTESRVAAAKKAIDAAAAIQPDAPEVHVARALLRYWGFRDYVEAISELEAARHVLPNDVNVLFNLGNVNRRRGRWEEAISYMQAALAVDPRNLAILTVLAETYSSVRRYDDAARVVDAALSWAPNKFDVAWQRAAIDVDSKADLKSMREVLESPAVNGASPLQLTRARLNLALYEHDYVRARDAIVSYQEPTLQSGGYVTPRGWYEGWVERGLGNPAKAETAFLTARKTAAANADQRPDDPKALIMLARIDAELGRKEDAINEGEHAVALLPVDKDAFDGPLLVSRLAGIYAKFGDKNRALDLLEKVTQIPRGPDYGDLKQSPVWDPLRGDPRFEKLVASLAPKETK